MLQLNINFSVMYVKHVGGKIILISLNYLVNNNASFIFLGIMKITIKVTSDFTSNYASLKTLQQSQLAGSKLKQTKCCRCAISMAVEEEQLFKFFIEKRCQNKVGCC